MPQKFEIIFLKDVTIHYVFMYHNLSMQLLESNITVHKASLKVAFSFIQDGCPFPVDLTSLCAYA